MTSEQAPQPGGRPPFPAPVPSQDNEPFWDALKQGELHLQACASCSALQHPPRAMCASCGSFDLGWRQASGRGSVYTYAVTHQPIHPALQGFTPFATVLIELEEGPRLASNLVDVAPDEIEIGMPVHVVFEPLNEEITLPLFRRA
ncbi:MAG: Zn-ribbon domain-containing OB-fold protein [Dehalococcoidia bacterium]|nr:Zn-ribbon domain-containing OB-fold protein [Dehalococcoidia bacterium]